MIHDHGSLVTREPSIWAGEQTTIDMPLMCPANRTPCSGPHARLHKNSLMNVDSELHQQPLFSPDLALQVLTTNIQEPKILSSACHLVSAKLLSEPMLKNC